MLGRRAFLGIAVVGFSLAAEAFASLCYQCVRMPFTLRLVCGSRTSGYTHCREIPHGCHVSGDPCGDPGGGPFDPDPLVASSSNSTCAGQADSTGLETPTPEAENKAEPGLRSESGEEPGSKAKGNSSRSE